MTVINGFRRKKLGEFLVDAGLISQEQLVEALKTQKETGKRLGRILLEKRLISEEALDTILSEQLGVAHVWLRKGLVDPKIVHIIPQEKARLYQVIPMFKVKNTLTIATTDPQAIFIFDTLAKMTGCEINPVVCRADDIAAAIEEYYQAREMTDRLNVQVDDFLADLEESDLQLVENPMDKDYQSISAQAEDSPIINLVNMIILKAVQDRASDIHLEPDRNKFRVRYRIDGVLYQVMTPRTDLLPGGNLPVEDYGQPGYRGAQAAAGRADSDQGGRQDDRPEILVYAGRFGGEGGAAYPRQQEGHSGYQQTGVRCRAVDSNLKKR